MFLTSPTTETTVVEFRAMAILMATYLLSNQMSFTKALLFLDVFAAQSNVQQAIKIRSFCQAPALCQHDIFQYLTTQRTLSLFVRYDATKNFQSPSLLRQHLVGKALCGSLLAAPLHGHFIKRLNGMIQTRYSPLPQLGLLLVKATH